MQVGFVRSSLPILMHVGSIPTAIEKKGKKREKKKEQFSRGSSVYL